MMDRGDECEGEASMWGEGGGLLLALGDQLGEAILGQNHDHDAHVVAALQWVNT